MRLTQSFEQKWLTDARGNLFGFGFNADASTEHEVGIKPLRSAFGITKGAEGIQRFQVTKKPKELRVLEHGEDLWLVYPVPKNPSDNEWRSLEFYCDYKHNYGETNLAAAWGEGAFAIRARGTEHQNRLKTLATALRKKDAAILLTIQGLSMGLNIVICSRFPEDLNRSMTEKQRETEALTEAWFTQPNVENLKATLKDAGCSWFYLSGIDKDKPGRIIRDGNEQLRVWLNPYDQRAYRAGWYTLHDLFLWAEGKGPIPYKAKP